MFFSHMLHATFYLVLQTTRHMPPALPHTLLVFFTHATRNVLSVFAMNYPPRATRSSSYFTGFFLRATCYPPPALCYTLLVFFYEPRATRHPLFAILYLFFSTSHVLPATCYSLFLQDIFHIPSSSKALQVFSVVLHLCIRVYMQSLLCMLCKSPDAFVWSQQN